MQLPLSKSSRILSALILTVFFLSIFAQFAPPSIRSSAAFGCAGYSSGSPLFCVPIVLTNTQAQPTPNPFPISISMDWATYGKFLNSTQVQNVGFVDSAGGALPAWCETLCTPSATNSLVWVKDDQTIPPLSAQTIYLLFYSNATNNFGITKSWGENPLATSTYGQYDNGAQVFAFYDNFSGTSLGSKWTINNAGHTALIKVSNGIYIGENSGVWGGIYSNAYSAPASGIAIDVSLSTNSSNAYYEMGPNSATTSSFCGPTNGACFENRLGDGTPSTSWRIESSNGNTASGGASATSTRYIVTGYDNTTANLLVNYTSVKTHVGSIYTQHVTIGTFSTPEEFTQWIRTRALPPAGIMPTAAFEPLISIGNIIIDFNLSQSKLHASSTPINTANYYVVFCTNNGANTSYYLSSSSTVISCTASTTVTFALKSALSNESIEWVLSTNSSKTTFTAPASGSLTVTYYYYNLVNASTSSSFTTPASSAVSFTAPATAGSTDNPTVEKLGLTSAPQTFWHRIGDLVNITTQSCSGSCPSLIQTTFGSVDTSKSVVVPYFQNVTSGHLLVVGVGVSNPNFGFSKITDTLGNTWSSQESAKVCCSTSFRSDVYYFSTIASSSGADSVNVTWAGANTALVVLYEISNALNVFANSTGSGTTSGCCSVASYTPNSNSFVIGMVAISINNPGPSISSGSDYTLRGYYGFHGALSSESNSSWTNVGTTTPFTPSAQPTISWAESSIAFEPIPAPTKASSVPASDLGLGLLLGVLPSCIFLIRRKRGL